MGVLSEPNDLSWEIDEGVDGVVASQCGLLVWTGERLASWAAGGCAELRGSLSPAAEADPIST